MEKLDKIEIMIKHIYGDTELHIDDIAGSAIASLEYIPLTLYRPFGLALILWIWSGDRDIEIRGCTRCPWSSLYEDKRSYDLISVNIGSIVKRVEELHTDLLFLHGGEPISRPWLSSSISMLKQLGIPVGIKARVELLEKYDVASILRYVDALLIEVPSWISKDLLKRILYDANMKNTLSRKDLYVELLFTDIVLEKQLVEKITEINRFLETLARSGQPVPIGFHAYDLSEREILSLARIINRACSGICYVIESINKVSPEEIRCPSCKTVVARRKETIILPARQNSAECPGCGVKIFRHEPHRVRRTQPIFSPVIIK